MISSTTLKSGDAMVYLFYMVKGVRKRFQVALRYMDKKECFFSHGFNINFEEPKDKIPATIIAYTKEGVYSANVKLLTTSISTREILYNLTMPSKWDFKQLRGSTRKECNLPLIIRYDDGMEITSVTRDISLGGVSFIQDEEIPSIYESKICELELELPDDLAVNFPGNKLVTPAKYTRKKSRKNEYGSEYTIVAYKFLGLNSQEKIIMKNFLINIR